MDAPAISSITDRVPSISRVPSFSTVTDHLPSVDGIGVDRLPIPEIDVDAAVRRSRRIAARVIPWMSSPRRRVQTRWLVVGGALVVVSAGAILWRRRSSTAPEPASTPSRDDWRAGNGRAVQADSTDAADAGTSTAPATAGVG